MDSKKDKRDKLKDIKSSASDSMKNVAKTAVDASKLLMGVAAIKAVDELQKIVLKYPERPKEQSRRKFAQKQKPTRTYTQAARWIYQEDQSPQKKQEKDTKKPLLHPGFDGIISFSLLLVPFTILLGILLVVAPGIDEFLLIILLIFYTLLIALPGAYLGLDAIYYGGKSYVSEGGKTFWAMIMIFWRGLIELFYIFTNLFAEILRGAFQEVQDYWVFVLTYLASLAGLYVIFNQFLPSETRLIIIIFFVAIPALLPASLLHGLWSSYIWKKQNPI